MTIQRRMHNHRSQTSVPDCQNPVDPRPGIHRTLRPAAPRLRQAGGTHQEGQPVRSPDGALVATARLVDGRMGIYVKDVATGEERVVAGGT